MGKILPEPKPRKKWAATVALRRGYELAWRITNTLLYNQQSDHLQHTLECMPLYLVYTFEISGHIIETFQLRIFCLVTIMIDLILHIKLLKLKIGCFCNIGPGLQQPWLVLQPLLNSCRNCTVFLHLREDRLGSEAITLDVFGCTCESE